MPASNETALKIQAKLAIELGDPVRYSNTGKHLDAAMLGELATRVAERRRQLAEERASIPLRTSAQVAAASA